MTVLEMHPYTDPTMRWTGVCADEHRAPGPHTDEPRAAAVRTVDLPPRERTAGRVAGRPAGRRDATSPTRAATIGRATHLDRAVEVGTAPSRRRSPQAGRTSHDRVRACRVEAPTPAGVVDDVPAWALLACGVVVGVAVLLAVAFLGGPAYA